LAKAARLLLYALLLWAPLPLASNRAIVWVVNGAWALVILCCFIAGEYASRTERPADWRRATWAVAGITVWAVWMVIQAAPFTPGFLHHPVWSSFAADIPGARGAISINPSATWATIAEFVPIVLLGLVAFGLAHDRRRARVLLEVVVAATVLVAMLGFVSVFTGFDLVSLLDAPHYHGYLTGTFVGRSAAASYFAIGMVAAASLIAARIEERFSGGNRRLDRSAVAAAILDSAGWIAGFLVLLLALLETGSRGGVIAATIGVLVVVALSMPATRFGLGTGVIVALCAGVAFGAMLRFAGGRFLDRLEEGVGDQDRLQVYRETLDMILARPVLGQGAGSFADAYPMFQGPGEHNIVWLRAHSTYLQAAAELGLPVFAVALATILFVLIVIARGTLQRVEPMPAALAALAAGTGLAIQSAIDFSVQIQAVALTVVAVIGAGFGEAVALRRHDARGEAVEPASALPARTVPVRPVRFERVSMTIPAAEARTTPPPAAGEFESVQVTIPTRRSPETMTSLPAGTLPEGTRLYVFGDVHGRFDLVQRLRDAIRRDRARSTTATVQVIGLGDFIDRGPDSKSVIEALTSDFFECDAAYIRGNHEQLLLDFLDDPENGPLWLRNGARETLRSYGVDVADANSGTRVDYPKLRTAFRARLPQAHAAFLDGLPLSLAVGGYFFVHAGARPGVPLHQQKSSDMLWIRDGFADRDEQFEKIVVHGHTPVERPYLGRYRINLDTGAYLTNRLSCLVLESRERRILEL